MRVLNQTLYELILALEFPVLMGLPGEAWGLEQSSRMASAAINGDKDASTRGQGEDLGTCCAWQYFAPRTVLLADGS